MPNTELVRKLLLQWHENTAVTPEECADRIATGPTMVNCRRLYVKQSREFGP
jgi:hypothetical protein